MPALARGSTPTPEIRRGQPSVKPGQGQLPSGLATKLNEALAVAGRLAAGGFTEAARTVAGGTVAPTEAGPVGRLTGPAPGASQAGGARPLDDDDQFVLSDPADQGLLPRTRTGMRPPVPESVKAYLPLLARAALSPGSPVALKLLYRAVVSMAREDES